MDPKTPNHEPLLEWKAKSRVKHERGKIWYAVAAVLTLLLLAYSISTQAWTFTGIIILTSIAFVWVQRLDPDTREIYVWDEGFELDGTFVEWEHATGFYMLQGPDYIELHIEHDRTITGELVIHTGDVDPTSIRSVLSVFIPELTQRRERTVDRIGRICKI